MTSGRTPNWWSSTSGGSAFAAGLPEPLPGADAAALARQWLGALPGSRPSGLPPNADEDLERWLRAVAHGPRAAGHRL